MTLFSFTPLSILFDKRFFPRKNKAFDRKGSESMNQKMVDQLTENYKLQKEEHNRVFEMLKEKLFINKVKETNLSVLFVVGQPGSGKTTYIKNTDFSKYININSDEYRVFHQHGNEIVEKYPTHYAKLTNYDAHLWGDELFSYAIEHGYSVLREKAPTNDSLLEIMKTIPSNYEVAVHVVLTGNLESLLRIHERYERDLMENKIAKLSSRETHNKCYQLLPDFVKKCLELNIKVSYVSAEENQWKTQSIQDHSLEILQKAREESNKNACIQYDIRMHKIKESKKLRNAFQEEWDELEKIEDIYLEIKKLFML